MSRASDAYARYGRALLRKAERILQSRADAQDVVHALFTDLLQSDGEPETASTTLVYSAHETTSRRSVSLDLAYLHRAITNRCLTLLRDAKNRARLLSDHDVMLRGGVRTRCDERAIDMDLLLKLTQTLDEPTLEVLICRFFDDMTQEEIAGSLGISRKTVGRRLEDAQHAVLRLSSEPPRGQP